MVGLLGCGRIAFDPLASDSGENDAANVDPCTTANVIICDDFERPTSNVQGAWGAAVNSGGTASLREIISTWSTGCA
jgi:hypothetical protein